VREGRKIKRHSDYFAIDLKKGRAVMIGTVYFYLSFHNMEYVILMINILLTS